MLPRPIYSRNKDVSLACCTLALTVAERQLTTACIASCIVRRPAASTPCTACAYCAGRAPGLEGRMSLRRGRGRVAGWGGGWAAGRRPGRTRCRSAGHRNCLRWTQGWSSLTTSGGSVSLRRLWGGTRCCCYRCCCCCQASTNRLSVVGDRPSPATLKAHSASKLKTHSATIKSSHDIDTRPQALSVGHNRYILKKSILESYCTLVLKNKLTWRLSLGVVSANQV